MTTYFDLIHEVRPGLTFKNQTFYDVMDHTKYSTYGFAADYRPWVIENKTMVDWAVSPSESFVLQSTSGWRTGTRAFRRASRVAAGIR